ncbi:hypothetical protein VNI00_019019 [Paramarasmius palmivorus]|uniref:NACHT domain-containing protein n=1 Tax=Paramarasmius palmivorus TaxID=297713 RepID=A0AAW0AS73_9AGAR
MFSGNTVNEISGGVFNHVLGTQINKTRIVNHSNDAIQMLWNAIADVGATHDAETRYPPPKCHPQTRLALLDTLLDWIRSSDQATAPACWLSGPAGSGKSAIAQTVADIGEREGFLASSFFFSRDDPRRNNPSSLILVLAYEMAGQVDGLRHQIERALKQKPNLLQATVEKQFKELVLKPLSSLTDHEWTKNPPLVIIDGLDECEGSEAQKRVLHLLIYALKDRIPLRFLICSRPEISLREIILNNEIFRLITLDDSWTTSSDIKLVLCDGFARIRESRKYEQVRFPDPWPSDEAIEELDRKACGQFLYVTTVLKFVDDDHSQPWKRLDEILSATYTTENGTPYRDLDHLYCKILSCNPDHSRVVDILGTVLNVENTRILDDLNRVVSPSLVEDVLGLLAGDVSLALRDMHSVLDIGSAEKRIKVLHASFIDFLHDQSRSHLFFVDDSRYCEPFFIHRMLRGVNERLEWYMHLPDSARSCILEDDFLLGPDWQAGSSHKRAGGHTPDMTYLTWNDLPLSGIPGYEGDHGENLNLDKLLDLTLKASIRSGNQSSLSDPFRGFDTITTWLETHSAGQEAIMRWFTRGTTFEMRTSNADIPLPATFLDDLSTVIAFQIFQAMVFPDDALPEHLIDSVSHLWHNVRLHRNIFTDLRVVGVGRHCTCDSFYPNSISFLCKNGVYHLQLHVATIEIIKLYTELEATTKNDLSFVLTGLLKYWGPQEEMLSFFLDIAKHIRGTNDLKRAIVWLNSFDQHSLSESVGNSSRARLHACYVRIATDLMQSIDTNLPGDYGIALWYPLLCFGEPSLLRRCGPEVDLLPLFGRILRRTKMNSTYGLPEETVLQAHNWLQGFPLDAVEDLVAELNRVQISDIAHSLMSKPVLYTFGGSVWAAAPELAVAELYPEGSIDTKVINLLQGENFNPTFIKLNPNATLPTLEANGKAYTSTKDVIAYLVENASRPVKKGTKLIDIIHEDRLDPNFAFLLSRNEEELKAKGAGMVTAFLAGRQEALNKFSSTPEATAFKSFFESKLAANGGLLGIYKGEAPAAAKEGFFKQSQNHYDTIATFVNQELPRYLPESGFVGGDQPGEDDFHLGAWLARIAATLGAKQTEEGLEAFEKAYGKKLPEKVVKYWKTWAEQPSWKKVYTEGIH